MGNDSYHRGYRSDPPGRGGSSDSGPSTDPLTELARLIGQGDPFAAEAGRPQRRPEQQTAPSDWHAAPARGAPAYDDDAHDERYPADADDDERYHGEHHDGSYPPNPRAHTSHIAHDDGPYDEEGGYQDQSYYDDPHDAAHASNHDDPRAPQEEYGAYYGDGEDEYDDEAPAPRRRGWLVTAAALVGLAVVGTAGAFAYRAVFTGGPPAIIARDPGPNKIMPSQTADASTTKQLDRLTTRSADERFVAREEQPIALPEPARNPPAPLVGQGVASAYPSAPSNIAAPPTIPADNPPPAAPGNGAGPRKIRTLAVNSDMSPVDTASTRPSPRLPSQGPAARASTQRAPLSLSPQEDASPPPQVAAVPPPVPAPPVAAPPAAPPVRTSSVAPAATPPASIAASEASGNYFVQITAQRSEEEAQSSYQNIQAKYASLLSGHQPVIRRKDLGSKGIFFGAQIGPFSHEDAVSMCQSLKSAGAPCMLQKN